MTAGLSGAKLGAARAGNRVDGTSPVSVGVFTRMASEPKNYVTPRCLLGTRTVSRRTCEMLESLAKSSCRA